MKHKNWFCSWFDTDFYHILYRDRNDEEARVFIQHILNHLDLDKKSYVLDLACGKGRHSITLNQFGFKVLGADLSENSISEAKKHANERLKFIVHDMRFPIENESFDAVFNLFTSFGYFDSQEDNERVLQSIYKMLNPKGILVIDFMNATKAINELVPTIDKVVDGIHFHITKNYNGNHIFKRIQFVHDNQEYDFEERVQALKLSDFSILLEKTGFHLKQTFGNFDLSNFDEKKSDRLILIAEKKEWK